MWILSFANLQLKDREGTLLEEGQSSIQLFSMIVDRDQGYGREIANGRLRILSSANLQRPKSCTLQKLRSFVAVSVLTLKL